MQEEKEFYQTHNNDILDKRYQLFVSPITLYIFSHFSPQAVGLDFGAGTGPVISYLLQQKGFNVLQYDPFFHPNTELLEKKYDFIVCCEVIEHFHNPRKEFALLRKMLNPNGNLVCMTQLYDQTINFRNWYYKNDQTHVFFYRENTIQWIRDNFSFSEYKIDSRLLVLKV